MSSLTGGSKQSSSYQNSSVSTPVNLQNSYYTGLSSGVAGGLADIFQSNSSGVNLEGGGTTGGYYTGGSDTTATDSTGTGTGTTGTTKATGATGSKGGSGGYFSPFLVDGKSSATADTNALVAPLTTAEKTTVSDLSKAGGAANLGATGSEIQAGLTDWTNKNGYKNLTSNAADLLNSFMDPNYAANLADSPQTQRAISAANAPLENTFRNTTAPGITAASTLAGQKAGGTGQAGSSAFDQAYSTGQGNLLADEAYNAGGIANAAYQAGLSIQSQAPAAADTLSSDVLKSTESAYAAPSTISGYQITDMLNSLEGEMLPQLTDQYGINQGVSLYNSQINDVLQALGYGGQVSQPVLGNNASSQGTGESTGSSTGSLLSGFSSLLGGVGSLK